MAEKCFNCRFADKGGPNDLECRRYPPKASRETKPAFPILPRDWWCGEWQPKKREEWSL